MTLEEMGVWLHRCNRHVGVRPAEWVAAYDDLFCRRITHCACCGQETGSQSLTGIWDFLDQQRSVAYVLCGACQRQPTWQTTVRALLEERYALGRWRTS